MTVADAFDEALDKVLPEETAPAAAPEAAPAEPAAPSQPRDESGRFAPKSEEPAREATPAAAAPSPTPATPAPEAAKPKRTFKVDHEEHDYDEWLGDEEKRKRLTEWTQKGYAADRLAERAAAERERAIANDLYARGFRFTPKIPNPQSLADFEIVPPQAATPAAKPVDPLTKEIAELEQLAESDSDPDPRKTLKRLALLYAQREAHHASAAEVEKLKRESAQRAQEDQAQQSVRKQLDDYRSEVAKEIEARTKSFEKFPDAAARKARLLEQVVATSLYVPFTEAERAAGMTALAKAKALVAAEVGGLDAAHEAWRKSVTAPAATPAPPPVIGSAGSGSNGRKKPDLNTDEGWEQAFGEIDSKLAARR